jgi:thioredoxin 1
MSKLQIIDFYAEWCGPCKMLTPIINQLQEQFKDNETIEVIKYNVDEVPELAKSFNIKSIPTILFVKDDEVLHKINGATSKTNILSKIDELK